MPSAERWIGHRIAPEQGGLQVREVLRRTFRLSLEMTKRLVRSGGIRLDGDTPFLSNRVRPGQWLAIRLSSTEDSGLRAVPMDLVVVLDDPDVLVVDKPAGMLVHPSRPSHVRTLAHGVLALYRERGVRVRPHPVHRLDRDTTGLVLFAAHSLAHQRLDRQMRTRRIVRSYLAVVQGVVEGEEGRITTPIGRSAHDAFLRAQDSAGAAAATHFTVRERLADATLLEIRLETGRTHQIRVHLAGIGHPLIGDAAYGGAPHAAMRRQALHAAGLSFAHPMTGTALECAAEIPGDMRDLLDALRGSA